MTFVIRLRLKYTISLPETKHTLWQRKRLILSLPISFFFIRLLFGLYILSIKNKYFRVSGELETYFMRDRW